MEKFGQLQLYWSDRVKECREVKGFLSIFEVSKLRNLFFS